MTSKKADQKPTIPVRGAVQKKRESIQKMDNAPIKLKLKVSHR